VGNILLALTVVRWVGVVTIVEGEMIEVCRDWTTLVSCVNGTCKSFHHQDIDCRGRGGFEYGQDRQCVLPGDYSVLVNAEYVEGGDLEYHKIGKETCATVEGFRFAGEWKCASEDYGTLVWTDPDGGTGTLCSEGAWINAQCCALPGSRDVIPNCDQFGACYEDLRTVCNPTGGDPTVSLYAGKYFTDLTLVSLTDYAAASSCVMKNRVSILSRCADWGQCFDEGWGECLARSGRVYNGRYNCILSGEHTQISLPWGDFLMDSWMDLCTMRGGFVFNANHSCALAGLWTTVALASPATNLTGASYSDLYNVCVAQGGFPGLAGPGRVPVCALPGEWTSLTPFCTTLADGADTDTCRGPFEKTACEELQGLFLPDLLTCVIPGRYAVLDSCSPDGACDDWEHNDKCDWSQCTQAGGFLYDDCRRCAIPARCRVVHTLGWRLGASIIAFGTVLYIICYTVHTLYHAARAKRK